VTVIVSGRVVMPMAAVRVKSTTVSEHSHWNSDVTQHQQYRGADENGEKDCTSLHARPLLVLGTNLARLCGTSLENFGATEWLQSVIKSGG
jgi:hypothetical protein